MAGAFVQNVGSGGAAGSATTFSITVSPVGGVAIGDTVVVYAATGTGAGTVTCADSRSVSNAYTQIAAETATSPTGYIFVCTLAVALLQNDTITLTSGSKVVWQADAEDFSGVTVTTDGAATTATGSSLAPSGTNANAVNASDLTLALTAWNNNSAYTEDTTNTGGGDTWHGTTKFTTTGRSGQGAYKLTTSAVSQTHAPAIATSITWSETMISVKQSGSGVARALTGTGAAAAAGSGALNLAAALGGTGAASAAGPGSVKLSAALAGHGDAASAGSASAKLAASLSGPGTAAAAGSGSLGLAADLRGHGDAAAAGSGSLKLAAALMGTGTAAAAGPGSLSLTAALAGHGDAASGSAGALSLAAALAGQAGNAAAGSASLTVDVAAAIFVLLGIGNGLHLAIKRHGVEISGAVASPASPVVTGHILTEAGDSILTEAGDFIVQEG